MDRLVVLFCSRRRLSGGRAGTGQAFRTATKSASAARERETRKCRRIVDLSAWREMYVNWLRGLKFCGLKCNSSAVDYGLVGGSAGSAAQSCILDFESDNQIRTRFETDKLRKIEGRSDYTRVVSDRAAANLVEKGGGRWVLSAHTATSHNGYDRAASIDRLLSMQTKVTK